MTDCPLIQLDDGQWWCPDCDEDKLRLLPVNAHRPCKPGGRPYRYAMPTPPEAPPPEAARPEGDCRDHPMPSMPRRVWNLAQFTRAFISDGLRMVSEETYRQRLAACDQCDSRVNESWCGECGCYLPAKAKARAAICDLGEWDD